MAYERVKELEKYGQRHAPLSGFGATTDVDIAAGAAVTKSAVMSGLDPNSKTGKLVSAAFDWSYQATVFGLNVAAQNATVQKIRAASNDLFAASRSGVNLAAGFSSGKFKADAAGVIDGAKAVQGFVDAITKFGDTLGWNPRVGQEIQGWSNVATGCAAMIASQSPILGGLGCAASFLLKIFESIFGIGGGDFNLPATKLRSIFAPNAESWPLILTDAVRLASVLKTYYPQLGSTYEAYRSRLGPKLAAYGGISDLAQEWQFRWLTDSEMYPDIVAGVPEQKPLPAHNLRSILQLLDSNSDPLAVEKNVRAGLAFCAGYRSLLEPIGRGLMERYDYDNDLNVAAIENMAWFGRSAIAGHGDPTIIAELHNGGNLEGWEHHGGGQVKPDDWAGTIIDFAPFIRLDELINFFAAISIVEMRQFKHDAFNDFYFGRANPVRMVSVRDGIANSRQGEPGDDGAFNQGFGSKCWTNLLRSVPACGDVGGALLQGSPLAFKEFGAMRLMAAFSAIHMQYMWSVKKTRPIDPFAGVPAATNELQAPIDPRQAIQGPASWTLAGADGAALTAQVRAGTAVAVPPRFGHGESDNFAGLHQNSKPLVAAPALPAQTYDIPQGFPTWQAAKAYGKISVDEPGDWYRPALHSAAVISDQIQAKEALLRNAILAGQRLAALHITSMQTGAGAKICDAKGHCANVNEVIKNVNASLFLRPDEKKFLDHPVEASSPLVLVGGAALLALLLLK